MTKKRKQKKKKHGRDAHATEKHGVPLYHLCSAVFVVTDYGRLITKKKSCHSFSPVPIYRDSRNSCSAFSFSFTDN